LDWGHLINSLRAKDQGNGYQLLWFAVVDTTGICIVVAAIIIAQQHIVENSHFTIWTIALRRLEYHVPTEPPIPPSIWNLFDCSVATRVDLVPNSILNTNVP
jgi:hypothetical protein